MKRREEGVFLVYIFFYFDHFFKRWQLQTLNLAISCVQTFLLLLNRGTPKAWGFQGDVCCQILAIHSVSHLGLIVTFWSNMSKTSGTRLSFNGFLVSFGFGQQWRNSDQFFKGAANIPVLDSTAQLIKVYALQLWPLKGLKNYVRFIDNQHCCKISSLWLQCDKMGKNKKYEHFCKAL